MHERCELLLTLFMGQCQIHDESPAEMINLTQGDINVLFPEFMSDLFAITTTHKQSLSDIVDDIKGVAGAGRHQPV